MLNTDFYYNGEMSVDKGIYIVNMSSTISSPFLAKKKLQTESIAGRDKPYYYGYEKDPLKFTLTLSCLEGYWTISKRRELARWLDTDNYELFYSVDDISKWYYCQYVGGIDLKTNGMLQGTIEVEFECDSPYAYSPYANKNFDFSTIVGTQDINIDNLGDVDIRPEMWITKVGSGNIKIENLTNSDMGVFEFTGLLDNETIYIDNNKETILTDVSNTYRYSNFNDNYLVLKRGKNTLRIEGQCTIQFRCQYKILG